MSPQHGFAYTLKRLGFFLWTVGSHVMIINIRFAFWRDPYGCVCRVEPAAEAVEMIDDFGF